MVYHFTIHAYGTWFPDRAEGSLHYRRGYQTPSKTLADRYRENQREMPARFDEDIQPILIQSARSACLHQERLLYAIATDHSHFHLLLGWKDDERETDVMSKLKRSLTIDLNKQVARRTWFVRKGYPQQVLVQDHFDYLRETYLPSHVGWKWDVRRGLWK